MINNDRKDYIVAHVRHISELYSQNKVARRAGVSPATITQMVKGNWALIRPELWTKVEKALYLDPEWVHVETSLYEEVTQLLSGAQARGMSIGISHQAGTGKSQAYKRYANHHKEVIYLQCKNSWTKRLFVENLYKAAGLECSGKTADLIDAFSEHLMMMMKPLVILDQLDKAKDPQMDLFMDMYNDLDGRCGFVLSGVPALQKRIDRGRRLKRTGYEELYSRIGRKFLTLSPISHADVAAVCTANGVKDQDVIDETYECCEGDMRRVRRSIDRYFLIHH